MDVMPSAKDLSHLECTLANGVEVFGDRWSLLIIRDAFLGVRRFDDFAKDLGIARNILSERLDRLVAAGVLETRPYEDRPPRHEYVLTAKGKDLLDVLLALWRWGDRWDPVPEDAERHLVHLRCGETTSGVVVCAHCREELHRSDLRIDPPLPVVAERLAKRVVPG
jgi:DNA-binding HxlR family transcriptional regulator